MPELPEVETVARTLAPDIEGKVIRSLEVCNPSSWEDTLPNTCVAVFQPKILKVGRRGKLLLIYFEPFWFREQKILGLAFHLKMTGRLFYYAYPKETETHTRIVINLDMGQSVFFDDARKFGYCRFITENCAETWDFWRKLAKDPLEMGTDEFISVLRGKNAGIKSLLLRQDIVSGVGNIYADEALFKAGILPDRKASRITEQELACLHEGLRAVLEESIRFCGSSIKDYRTAKGDVGSFQNKFHVYGREGQNCHSCGEKLQKKTVAGRTTVFCPVCQK